jgi:hypothetical protein
MRSEWTGVGQDQLWKSDERGSERHYTILHFLKVLLHTVVQATALAIQASAFSYSTLGLPSHTFLSSFSSERP